MDRKNHKPVRKTKRNKWLIFAKIIGILAILMLVIYIGSSILIKVGERRLYSEATSTAPVLSFEEEEEDIDDFDEIEELDFDDSFDEE